ncbi:MAG: bifunctional glutamate N-acetyltransferase/amino-acid acetyltransferase ArgJ [Oceanospirillaceae bacterium]|nr:bifunctional glutamate N-acetyltransferase/amino-acid acetyltransferase ArgJ [Oceanospirillaceae bacterium]
MAVGPGNIVALAPIAGVRIGVANAGIKQVTRPDVVLFEISASASVAGVFTKNAFCAAPVHVAKEHLQGFNEVNAARYLLVNTGNANAGTGEQGMLDAKLCCQALADKLGSSAQCVLPFSTGVIGELLPTAKITSVLDDVIRSLQMDNWRAAAAGILTTDTRIKGHSVSFELAGKSVLITGISKGSGMIRPNMATMLGFVATDADISPSVLQKLLTDATDQSFNRITVDGDTSTNDACILIASGASGVSITENTEAYVVFKQQLNALMLEIALQIVRDGEGATKLVKIVCEHAATVAEALEVAYTVAHSPLVKTALFASDANWGRILAAVGRSGLENLDVDRLKIYLDDICIVENGGRATSYTEEAGAKVMAQDEILIRIVLNRGEVSEAVWTTDLSHDYISINADYRS